MDNMQIEYGRETEYWASTALLKLCTRDKTEFEQYNLTKHLLTKDKFTSTFMKPAEPAVNRGSSGYNIACQGKIYRSKKRTLMTLKRRFSEETLRKLAEKHKFKRSWSMSTVTLNDRSPSNYRRPTSDLTDDLVRENESLSEHLGKLTRLVKKIGSDDSGRNMFYNVICPPNGNSSTELSRGQILPWAVKQQRPGRAVGNQGAHSEWNDFLEPRHFSDGRMFSSSPIPVNCCSFPCSPAPPGVHPLNTPLSASAPCIHDMLLDLRHNSTEEELKSSFENIKVDDVDDNEFMNL